MKQHEYLAGVKDGSPIGVGYFSVSFSFGILCAASGLSVLQSTLISLTNVTSAGQFAGLGIITAGGSLIAMVLSQLIINLRYALMSLSLGQRLGPRIRTGQRLAIAFFNTDEIFAVAMSRKAPLTFPYMLGLGTLPVVGWTLGTLVGAAASTFLPDMVCSALGVALYGMFVAIVCPVARRDKRTLVVVILAVASSRLFTWVPFFSRLPAGLPIVICTLFAAGAGAILFPLPEDDEED